MTDYDERVLHTVIGICARERARSITDETAYALIIRTIETEYGDLFRANTAARHVNAACQWPIRRIDLPGQPERVCGNTMPCREHATVSA